MVINHRVGLQQGVLLKYISFAILKRHIPLQMPPPVARKEFFTWWYPAGQYGSLLSKNQQSTVVWPSGLRRLIQEAFLLNQLCWEHSGIVRCKSSNLLATILFCYPRIYSRDLSLSHSRGPSRVSELSWVWSISPCMFVSGLFIQENWRLLLQMFSNVTTPFG